MRFSSGSVCFFCIFSYSVQQVICSALFFSLRVHVFLGRGPDRVNGVYLEFFISVEQVTDDRKQDCLGTVT